MLKKCHFNCSVLYFSPLHYLWKIYFINVIIRPDNNMYYMKLGLFIILVYCDAIYSTTLMSI